MVSEVIQEVRVTSEQEMPRAREELIHHIKSRLGDYYYFPSWLLDPKALDRDASKIYYTLHNEIREIRLQSDISELKYGALEVIAKQLIRIYLAIHLEKFETIDSLISETTELMTRCFEGRIPFLPEEYIPGIMYSLKGLEALFLTRQPPENSHFGRLSAANCALELYRKLNIETQIVILAIKQTFLGIVHPKSYNEQLHVLDKLIHLDSQNGEWYSRKYSVLKHQREESFAPQPLQEIVVIAQAASLSPKAPHINLRLYSALAQIAKEKGFDSCSSTDVGFGFIFKSSAEIRQYVKSKARKMIELDPLSVESNLTGAECFLLDLPMPFRYLDVSYGRMCLDRAIFYHPSSTRASRAMRKFLIEAPVILLDNTRFEKDRNLAKIQSLEESYLKEKEKECSTKTNDNVETIESCPSGLPADEPHEDASLDDEDSTHVESLCEVEIGTAAAACHTGHSDRLVNILSNANCIISNSRQVK